MAVLGRVEIQDPTRRRRRAYRIQEVGVQMESLFRKEYSATRPYRGAASYPSTMALMRSAPVVRCRSAIAIAAGSTVAPGCPPTTCAPSTSSPSPAAPFAKAA